MHLFLLIAACSTPQPAAPPADAAPRADATVELLYSARVDGDIEPCG